MASVQVLRLGAWRVVEMLTTPLVPADYLDIVAPLRNPDVLRARVVAVRRETDAAVTLVLRPGHGWRWHVPGQYVRLGVEVDGVRLWRPYSVTTPPGHKDGRIAVTVSAVRDGAVSTHLVERARPGMVLHLDRPAGEFTLPQPPPGKVLFVTAGSGITPVMGILRSTTLDDVVLVHSAPTAGDVIFGAELRAMADEGRIRLVERYTGVDGRLSPEDLAALVPDLFERGTWACGPNAMLDALSSHYAAAGAADRLHLERFRPAALVTGDGGTVTFTRSGTVVESDGVSPLLRTGEEAGVLLPSGCRMGVCYGCVLPLREGAVRDLRDGTLTTAAPGDGVLVQTCISSAAGACSIDA